MRLILLGVLALSACASHHLPDPHVYVADIRTAARVCADRGFHYVARSERGFFCLHSNFDAEPQAVAVEVAGR